MNLNHLRLAALGLLASLLAACGGAGGTASGPAPGACNDCGTALLTMTDAAGDFLSYTVDVTSLRLRKADGTMVQTLPATARIDFAQLVDLSEIISAGQIPAGQYVAATLAINYTNSNILVDDGAGGSVVVAPVNSAGVALGSIELEVRLDSRNRLMINRARVSHLAFDLDLAASNVVDLAARKVTVSPFVVATVRPPESRETRVRGRLVSVDQPGSSYTINIRPFNEETGELSQFVVHTTATTRFEISGVTFTGADGLAALAGQTGNPMTIAFGAIDGTNHVFTARRVLAATSAEDLRHDFVSGNVLARSGNTLTVGGVRVGQREGGNDSDKREFKRGLVTVTVGPDTRVTKEGQGAETLDIGDISVGQRIEAFGELARVGTASAGDEDQSDAHQVRFTLDATAGRVRLNYTHLFGTVLSAAGSLTLDLASIDGQTPARFNFAGTGAIPATDADPDHYEVATGALPINSLQVGEWARLFGFVSSFGEAPPDFRADTLVDFSDTRATLTIGWGDTGSTTPFSAMSGTALTVNLGNAPLRGAIELGERLIDLHSLTALTLSPSPSGELTFAIGHRSSQTVDNYETFADFAAALGAGLNGTTAIHRLVATGTWNAPGGAFVTRRLLVVLND